MKRQLLLSQAIEYPNSSSLSPFPYLGCTFSLCLGGKVKEQPKINLFTERLSSDPLQGILLISPLCYHRYLLRFYTYIISYKLSKNIHIDDINQNILQCPCQSLLTFSIHVPTGAQTDLIAC